VNVGAAPFVYTGAVNEGGSGKFRLSVVNPGDVGSLAVVIVTPAPIDGALGTSTEISARLTLPAAILIAAENASSALPFSAAHPLSNKPLTLDVVPDT
jgi:hypothetical protein